MKSYNTTAFGLVLLLSALLCTIVFAWVLLFAIVIMPGISQLDDGAFLRAFQVIDGVIQKNQPIFVGIWIGSILSLVICAGMGMVQLETRTDKVLLAVSTAAYLVSQWSTFGKNVPLNNRVQELDIAAMDNFAKKRERERFEVSWNSWNLFRTVVMFPVSVYLLSLLHRG